MIFVDMKRLYITKCSYMSKIQFCNLLLAGIVGSHPTGEMDVCLCECYFLSSRGLYIRLVTHPEESY